MDYRFTQVDLDSIDNENIIKDFYNNNQSDFTVFDPKIGPKGYGYEYYSLSLENEIIAICSIEPVTDKLSIIHSTTVKEELRGQGIGKDFNRRLELALQLKGVKKLASHVFTDNLGSIIMRLKMGYLIEGLLRDHEEMGKHEYIFGKLI